MSVSVLETFRESRGFLKSVATLVMFFFTFSFYSPSALAVKLHVQTSLELAARSTVGATEYEAARTLKDLKAQVRAHRLALRNHLQENLSLTQQVAGWMGLSSERADLSPVTEAFQRLQEQHKKALSSFDEVKAHLIEQQVSSEILDRHQRAVERYKAEHGKLEANFSTLNSAPDLDAQQSRLETIEQQLDAQKFDRSHSPVNPHQLPWSTPSSKVREPVTKDKDLQNILGMDAFNPSQYLAAIADSGTVMATAGVPGAGDLAETVEVKFTDEIKQLAAELNHDPVKIYTWVHNNIRFIPSYGSIQGGQMALDLRAGNAFDTASLLISLLRASGIAARYAYGTIEVPANKVMNWVGGVEVPQAAQQLLGQGGIPNVAIVQGGNISHIRMEHVWVEAWVDFEPSRGIRNVSGDQWISMDASFKQYLFEEGMGLSEQVPFDASGFISEIEATASMNESEGSISNLPQPWIRTALTSYQQQLESYIRSQNENAKVAEVLGLQKVKVKPHAPLSAGLPYRLVTGQQVFSSVPSSLQHKFRFALAYDQYGSEAFRFERPTAEIAGKKLALSFAPATQADLDVITSYLPQEKVNGEPLTPQDYPSKLPGYLINLISEFSVDGQVVHTGSAITMGTELHSQMGLWAPRDGWFLSQNAVVAGEYHAIAVDLQGVAVRQTLKTQSDMNIAEQKMESGDSEGVTKHDLMGNLLYSNILSYFGMNDFLDEISAQSANMVSYRAPSYGAFNTIAQTHYWYGIPRDVSFPGVTMDVDASRSISFEMTNNKDAWVAFNQAIGIRY